MITVTAAERKKQIKEILRKKAKRRNRKMVEKIKEEMISDKVSRRILWLTIAFVIAFFGISVLSYYFLPEGFLLRKNGISDFETSENLFLCTAQIFLYNMLSVAFIFFGSAFARKKEGENTYRTYGQVGFFVFILLNAVTLGTWSFTANTTSVPLMDRILRTFDIVHNAGLLEMYGQLLITSALATKYLLMTEGRKTTTRKIREMQFSKAELFALIGGFLLMLAGAYVESRAIIG